MKDIECPCFARAPIPKQVHSIKFWKFLSVVNTTSTYTRAVVVPIFKNRWNRFNCFSGERTCGKGLTALPDIPTVVSAFHNQIDLFPQVLADIGAKIIFSCLMSQWSSQGFRSPYAQISPRQPGFPTNGLSTGIL